MWTLGFYLALATFFVPKKFKKATGIVSIILTTLDFLWWEFFIWINHHYYISPTEPAINLIISVENAFYYANPLHYLNGLLNKLPIFIHSLINFILQLLPAIIGMKTRFEIVEADGKKKIKMVFDRPNKIKKENKKCLKQTNSKTRQLKKRLPPPHKKTASRTASPFQCGVILDTKSYSQFRLLAG